VLERLRERAAESERERAVRGASWLESALEWLRGLARPAVLRHGMAALRRGNLEAAFALLKEEVLARPDRPESTRLFWEAALSCRRPQEASGPMSRLIQREVASGDLDTATDHWIALCAEVPEARIEVSALVRLLPALRARIAAARGDVAQRQARERLGDALRRCVDPAAGDLPPALALRVVDEARGIDLEVARLAAQAALSAPNLHEAKRGKLEELLRALERGAWPGGAAAEPAAAPRPAPVAPRVATAKPAPPAPRPAPVSPRVATAKPAAAPRRPVGAAHPLAEPNVPTGSPGRRSVALSTDEIEAASQRLAERMAARAADAAAADADSDAPAAPAAMSAAEPRVPVESAASSTVPNGRAAVPNGRAAVPNGRAASPEFLSDAEAESAFGPPLEVDEADLSPDAGDAPILEAELSVETGDGSHDEELPLEIDGDVVSLEPDDDASVPEAAASELEFEFGSAGAAPDAADAELPELAAADAVELTPGAVEPTPDAAPAPARAAAPAYRAIEITPVELGADGLVAWEVAHSQRTRIDYRAVEFLVSAEVAGQGDAPVLLVDLVLRARPGRPRSALRMRADAFDAAALYPDRTDAGQALRALLSDLLERTRAVPLPDPDSALGVRPQRFESVAAYEAAVLRRCSA
jgi:hypothetical protein